MLRNEIRLFFFKEKIFFWKLLGIFRKTKMENIEKILFSFNIRNIKEIEDNIIIKFFYFLEVIANQKGFLKNFVKGHLKSRKKNINLTGQVTLRGFKVYEFLDYFIFFILPIFKKNFIKFNTKIDNVGNLSFCIKELSVLPGLTEEFIGLSSYPIKIDIIFRKSNLNFSKYFLKEFNFNL